MQNNSLWFIIYPLFCNLANYKQYYIVMNNLLFLGNIGAGEVIIVALVIILIFGGRKIPELMKGLGKGVKSFKEGMNEIEKDINSEPKDNSENK